MLQPAIKRVPIFNLLHNGKPHLVLLPPLTLLLIHKISHKVLIMPIANASKLTRKAFRLRSISNIFAANHIQVSDTAASFLSEPLPPMHVAAILFVFIRLDHKEP